MKPSTPPTSRRDCRHRSTRSRRFVVAALCCSLLAGVALNTVAPSAAIADSATTAYRPLTPCRLLDTRESGHSKPAALDSLHLAVRGRCGVSDDTTAVAITVTITEAEGPGFITAWPAGLPMPLASTGNFVFGETRANGALLSLGADGDLTLFISNSTHIVVDVLGEFSPADSATSGRLVPTVPARALDTRDSGGLPLPIGGEVTVALPAGVPADATALAVMITITAANGPTFVTAFPAGTQRPFTSLLNTDAAAQTRTATQIVPVSATGLTVYSNAGGHIIVDVVGYQTGASALESTDGLFVPLTPTRIVDTRGATRIYAGGAIVAATAAVTGPNAAAVAANITATESGPAGYLTAWAAQTAQPATPVVSYDKPGQTVPDLGIVAVSTAGMQLASSTGAHAVVDITGWFTGAPLATTTGPPTNTPPTRPQPTGPVGCLQYVPTPTSDGVYRISPGTYQTVVHIFTGGPKGPIVVVGDSLTAGSALQTARGLRAQGWGPICIDGTVARTIEFGTPTIPDGLDAAARIRVSNPIWNDASITWVVALGTNDVGFADGNLAKSDKYVADQIKAIGVNPIAWVNVHTERAGWQYVEAQFNLSIQHSGVQVIDWYNYSIGKPWFAGDLVHLNQVGSQARADIIAISVHPI